MNKDFFKKMSPKLIITIIVAILVLAIIGTSFFIVDQTEESVVLRLGKFNRVVGPGLRFKLPLMIEKNINVPTKVVQTMEFGTSINSSYVSEDSESVMLTGDLNIVNVQWIVQYKISNPEHYLFNVRNPRTTIRDISQSVVNQLVGDLPILSVMTNQRTNIEIQAQKMMQNIFDSYKMGTKIVTVKLKNIVPPVDVQAAFEDVNKAIQDMNRYINQGKEQYNKEIPKAKGTASQMIQVAQGYAAERVNNASGDVARFNAMKNEYEKNPSSTRTRLYLEAMEQILQDNSKVTIVDKNLENFLPLLTLNKGGI